MDQPRITPAYAGKSLRRLVSLRAVKDHPRVCGEKQFVLTAAVAAVGSPPRMRGKVAGRASRNLLAGITPAYAGKRRGSSFCTLPFRDHPRVCGEKVRLWTASWKASGSPPRMRGKD